MSELVNKTQIESDIHINMIFTCKVSNDQNKCCIIKSTDDMKVVQCRKNSDKFSFSVMNNPKDVLNNCIFNNNKDYEDKKYNNDYFLSYSLSVIETEDNLEYLINTGLFDKSKQYNNMTVFHHIATKCNISLLKKVVDKGFAITRTVTDQTPLMYVATLCKNANDDFFDYVLSIDKDYSGAVDKNALEQSASNNPAFKQWMNKNSDKIDKKLPDSKSKNSDDEISNTNKSEQNEGEEKQEDKEKLDKISSLHTSISAQSKIINDIKSAHADDKITVWKTADGKFNKSRLVSDSTAGIVGGSVGGLISSSVIKKNQVKKGFEDLSCGQSGTKLANWGDEFEINGATTKAECEKASDNGKNNIFVWASKSNTGDNFATLKEDTKIPANNACWTRIEISSADPRIKTDNMKEKYFIIGNKITCGSWLDESEIEKQILAAKKKARVGGTVASVFGGMAIGVGAMEAFGNKMIGGKVQGQKALQGDELLKSQILSQKDGEAEWKKYETAKTELNKLCKELKALGETAKECE
ncbi:MAG: hypothetical protein ACOX7D_03400 [Alphaproteobacteria bacterium]